MAVGESRYVGPAAQVAAGWTLERRTPPSRLNGANGLRTGADGRIYVAQVAGSAISAIDPDSGAIQTVSAVGGAITAPDDLVFDEAGNLYCTEITRDRVTVLRPDGSSDVIADGVAVANPITYHQGRLIAGELTIGGRILELDRGGGIVRTIAEGVPMPNAFEVGPDGKLYFPAQGANEIWRVSLDGGAPEVVAKDLGVPDSVKFHPDGYIVSTQVASGQVLKIDPVNGNREVLADIGAGLDNVTFVGKRIFVSHITGSVHEVTAPGEARPLVEQGLQWPMGLGVSATGTLQIADGMFAYTLDPGAAKVLAGTLFATPYPGFMRGVAASGANEWVVTTAHGTVARWVPGNDAETIAYGHEVPMGVAVHGGAVVFADAGAGRVLAIEAGETSELAAGLKTPSGVAISARGDIYVAEADGGRIVKVAGGAAETAFDGLGRPEGLAIRGSTLYAVDTATREVLEFDLVSGARRTLANGLPVGTPAGLPLRPGGVGDMCGPMWSFTGLAAAADGTIYVSGDAEGAVLALRPV